MSTITMTAGTGTTSGAGMSVTTARRDPRGPRGSRGSRTSLGPRVETAAAASRVRVRLTRRARLVLTLLAMVVLAVVLAVVVTGGSAASAGTSAPVTHQRVTMSPGQTLWQIAQRVEPGTDPRETIDAILRLNNLKTAEVQVGTALLLP